MIIAVGREQALAAAAQLRPIKAPVVLFFGNYAGMEAELADLTGRERSIFGFPGVGGTLDGSVVRYVQIGQQPTTLGRCAGVGGQAVLQLAAALRGAGSPVPLVADMGSWLDAHAALVVPIAAAIRGAGGSAAVLSADSRLLRLMVLATREAYGALAAQGRLAAPANLRLLYRMMPAGFAQWYWARTLRGEFGELAFAAHTRHAWPELAALGSGSRSGFASPLRRHGPSASCSGWRRRQVLLPERVTARRPFQAQPRTGPVMLGAGEHRRISSEAGKL